MLWKVYCAPLVPNTDSIHGAGNAVPRASPMRSRTELSHTLLLGGAGATTAAGVAAAALCSRATGSEVFTPPSNTFSATGGFIADAELEMSPKARLRSRGRGTAESHARSQAALCRQTAARSIWPHTPRLHDTPRVDHNRFFISEKRCGSKQRTAAKQHASVRRRQLRVSFTASVLTSGGDCTGCPAFDGSKIIRCVPTFATKDRACGAAG